MLYSFAMHCMKASLFTLIFFLLPLFLFAGNLTGLVTDKEGNVLPYASITIKGTSKGAIANSQGKFSIDLAPGNYVIVCQYVGYRSEERKITMTAADQKVDFRLLIQDLTMEEVVIRRGDDPAIEIIRETIRKREFYNKQVDSFTVDVYIKGLMRTRAIPDKVLGQKIDKAELEKDGFDSSGKGIVFLSESLTKVAFKQPDKIKYEVISTRMSGGGFGLSFPFFINFYTNNVDIFGSTVNPRGFISPISDNAFNYYRYKYEGNFFENGKMISQIKVIPRRKNEPLFSGNIFIVDGEWRFHSLDLKLTKDYQLELIDTIEVKQIHAQIADDIWKTQNQVVYLAVKTFGFDLTGNFLNVYNNYDLDPSFSKKYFNRVIMSYDTASNKRDSAYWSKIRPVPLEPDEKRDFVFKDSLSQAFRDSMYSRRNIDSLRSRQKPIQPRQFFLGGVSRNFYSTKNFGTYRIEPLLTNLQYNTVEGAVVQLEQSYSFRPRRGKYAYRLLSNTRYGFSNGHLNSYGSFTVRSRRENFRNRYVTMAGGKRVSQFNPQNPIDALTNSISTLVYSNNWMKIYENWFGQIEYNNKFESGLKLNVNLNYEDRLPVHNSTDFSLFNKEKNFSSNHPYELAEVPFLRHQALVSTISLSFQPGQRYIQYPYTKVPIGSKYPTFELLYAKGIPGLFSSDADFDKWKFTVQDNMNFKLKGEFRYRISAGGFLNSRKVDIPDYQHFIGNQTIFNANYLNSFQLAPYYRYSNTESLYGLAHVEHHFNGLLTNKIPLFNRLKWNLVMGSNTFYVDRKNYYAEAFAGLENIFKIFRVDFITAYQAEPGHSYGIRVGMGGILGGVVQRNRR
jgi:hypothetical protein